MTENVEIAFFLRSLSEKTGALIVFIHNTFKKISILKLHLTETNIIINKYYYI